MTSKYVHLRDQLVNIRLATNIALDCSSLHALFPDYHCLSHPSSSVFNFFAIVHWSKLEGSRIWAPRGSGDVQACLVCCSSFLPTCFSHRAPDREHQVVLYGLRQESSEILPIDFKPMISHLSMSCFCNLSFK